MSIQREIRMILALAGLSAACFAQAPVFTSVSAGNWGPIVAPDSIAAGFASDLTNQTYSALTLPLPTALGGVSVLVADSGSALQLAGLFASTTGQVNFQVPANTALGKGTATVATRTGGTISGPVLVSNVAPAIFAANGNGQGVAAAEIFIYTPSSGQGSLDYTFISGTSGYNTKPFGLSSSQQVFLVLFATGIRRHSLNPVLATVNGQKVPVTYAGAVSGSVGLDQINVGPLPASLAGTGKGDVPVVVIVDGVPSNTVTINIL